MLGGKILIIFGHKITNSSTSQSKGGNFILAGYHEFTHFSHHFRTQKNVSEIEHLLC